MTTVQLRLENCGVVNTVLIYLLYELLALCKDFLLRLA